MTDLAKASMSTKRLIASRISMSAKLPVGVEAQLSILDNI